MYRLHLLEWTCCLSFLEKNTPLLHLNPLLLMLGTLETILSGKLYNQAKAKQCTYETLCFLAEMKEEIISFQGWRSMITSAFFFLTNDRSSEDYSLQHSVSSDNLNWVVQQQQQQQHLVIRDLTCGEGGEHSQQKKAFVHLRLRSLSVPHFRGVIFYVTSVKWTMLY